jgi:hypothetical protein
MSDYKISLEASLKDFSTLMTSNDLVKIGLYSSIDQAYQSRLKGEGPSYIQPARKVLYPKDLVIKYMCDLLVDHKPAEEIDESLHNDEASQE